MSITTKNKRRQKAPVLVPLFVYGTLKKGFPLHEWMEDQKFVADVRIQGYTLISLGPYPALVDMNEPSADMGVAGELYMVEEGRFNQLRKMEERVGYSTQEVSTRTEDGEHGPKAFAFVFTKLVSCGDVKWTQTTVKGRQQMYPGSVVAA